MLCFQDLGRRNVLAVICNDAELKMKLYNDMKYNILFSLLFEHGNQAFVGEEWIGKKLAEKDVRMCIINLCELGNILIPTVNLIWQVDKGGSNY